MRRYEVYMHLSLLERVPRRGLARRKVMAFVYSLREHPDTPGDFVEKDTSLRERQVKIVEDYAITYWLDSPVHRVMVVDIRPADK